MPEDRQIGRSAASRQTVPAARASAMTPSPAVALLPSFPSAGPPGHGRSSPPGPRPGTSPARSTTPWPDALATTEGCHRRGHAVMWGGSETLRGIAFPTTGCRARGCRATGPWRGTSTGRSRRSRPAWPGPTATPRAALPSRRPQDKAVQGQEGPAISRFVQQGPQYLGNRPGHRRAADQGRNPCGPEASEPPTGCRQTGRRSVSEPAVTDGAPACGAGAPSLRKVGVGQVATAANLTVGLSGDTGRGSRRHISPRGGPQPLVIVNDHEFHAPQPTISQ